ncbi:MAG: BolA family transcriptional regulator [Desulfurellaceae bacterium]|nr:BolA family transcriptional regulator [Desulfurellaceae bacterium]
MNTAQTIEQILRLRLEALDLTVEDESALHAGHAGAASGGGHYRVRIVSPLFSGKNRVQRHRLVYAALADEMGGAIHALALTTLTPDDV